MAFWEQFRGGYQATRHGNGGCRVVGDRYPGCIADRIEQARAVNHARPQNQTEAAMPNNAPLRAPDVTARITQLESENAELRDVLAGYVERPDNSQLVANVTARIAQLESENAELRDVLAGYVERAEQHQGALAERDATLAKVAATRDRYQANGKRFKAYCLEMESILARSDVKKALQKTLHSDAHPQVTAPQRLAYDRAFAVLNAVYERIEAG